MKKALITGVTGQDGAYLAEYLLAKGYEVHGIKRRSSSLNTARVDHLYQDPHEENVRFFMHYGDLTDATNLIRIVQEVQPDESTTSRLKAMSRCLLRRPSTLRTQMPWGPSGSSRPYVFSGWWKRSASIRPRRANSTEKLWRFRRARKPLFILGVLMGPPSSMHTGYV